LFTKHTRHWLCCILTPINPIAQEILAVTLSRRMSLSLLLLTIIFILNSCIIVGNPFDGPTAYFLCKRSIDYQARKISVTGGFSIPFASPTVGKIKVGIVSDKKSIRRASDQIKLLDLIQYRACQDFLLTKDPRQREEIRRTRDNATILLINTLKNLKNSSSIEEYVDNIKTSEEETKALGEREVSHH